MLSFFTQFPEVLAVMSQRRDGTMSLYNLGEKDAVMENRKRFFSSLGISQERVLSALQTHGSNVFVAKSFSTQPIHAVDAFVSCEKDLFLSVTAADCYPVFFYDPKHLVFGIAHAGWRGIVGDVVLHVLEKMFFLGAKREDIFVEIGPGISQANFRFCLPDYMRFFGRYRQDRYVVSDKNNSSKVFVNLRAMIFEQLLEGGVLKEHVELSPLCTFSYHEKFFSARRDKKSPPDVMVSVIGVRS